MKCIESKLAKDFYYIYKNNKLIDFKYFKKKPTKEKIEESIIIWESLNKNR